MYETYKRLHDVVKLELLTGILMTFSFGLIGPVITKLEGLTFTVSILAGISIANKISIFATALLKSVRTNVKHIMLIVLVAIETVTLFMYSNEHVIVWLSIIVIIGVFTTMVLSSFYIDFDIVVAKTHDEDSLENIQYIERMVFSATGLIGAFVSMLFGDISIRSIMIMSGITMLIVTYVLVRQHMKYFKGKSRKDLIKMIESEK